MLHLFMISGKTVKVSRKDHISCVFGDRKLICRKQCFKSVRKTFI